MILKIIFKILEQIISLFEICGDWQKWLILLFPSMLSLDR
jgi:hypothetical protein